MHDRGDNRKTKNSQMQLFELEPSSETINPAKKTKERKSPYKSGSMYLVAISDIALNTEQPRRIFDDTELQSLAESIRTNGLLQPVLCHVDDNGIRLIAGERRLRAARMAGLMEIPIRIVTGDPLEIALIENLLRSDLTAIEEAEAIAALKKKKGFRLEDLAGITGKAVPTLSEIVSITRLPEEILTVCRAAKSVPRDILVLIARIPGKDDKITAFEQYMKGTLTRESLAARSRRVKKTHITKAAPFTYIRNIAKRFSRFDSSAMNRDEKEKLRHELQRLLGSITKAIDDLE